MSNILLVDDSSISRKNLARIIHQNSKHTVIASAAKRQEAIQLYRLHKPDIVTLDITMPVMNGIETLGEIIALDQKARVIMVTAMDQPNKILEALEIGAISYISKPFEAQRIIKAIEDAIKEPTEN